MRAAAIFGLGSSAKDLKPFQKNSDATWLIGLPARSSEADAILIFGGDGTVHRHLAQLVRLQLPVLVAPCGSGNDFARALNLRSIRDSLAAWRKFSSAGGNVRTIDLGLIKALAPEGVGAAIAAAEADPSPERIPARLKPCPDTNPQGTEHYFCCVGGVGLDGEIARRANELPSWLRGHGGYVLSLMPALFQFVPLPMRISLPDSDQPSGFVEHSAKATLLVAFANAPTYGGGMKIAPRAQIDDGKLDICIVSDIDKFKFFCLFPTVYFGRHLSMPEVEYLQTERLRLETERPMDVYADGEFVCRTPIEVSVARRALRVIVHSSQTDWGESAEPPRPTRN
jgi:diacylglycerol kinase (ATP)